jgi:hypothetical protein
MALGPDSRAVRGVDRSFPPPGITCRPPSMTFRHIGITFPRPGQTFRRSARTKNRPFRAGIPLSSGGKSPRPIHFSRRQTASGTSLRAPLAARNVRSAALFTRSSAVFTRSPALFTRSSALFTRSSALFARSPALFARSPALFTRSSALFTRSSALFTRSSALFTRSSALFTRSSALFTRSSALFTRSSALFTRSSALFTRSPALFARSSALFARRVRHLGRPAARMHAKETWGAAPSLVKQRWNGVSRPSSTTASSRCQASIQKSDVAAELDSMTIPQASFGMKFRNSCLNLHPCYNEDTLFMSPRKESRPRAAAFLEACDSPSEVERTSHHQPRSIEHMGIDHGRAHVIMPQ